MQRTHQQPYDRYEKDDDGRQHSHGGPARWGGAFNYTDPENTSSNGCFKFASVYVSSEYDDGEWWFHDLDQMTYSNYGCHSGYLPAGDNISNHI